MWCIKLNYFDSNLADFLNVQKANILTIKASFKLNYVAEGGIYNIIELYTYISHLFPPYIGPTKSTMVDQRHHTIELESNQIKGTKEPFPWWMHAWSNVVILPHRKHCNVTFDNRASNINPNPRRGTLQQQLVQTVLFFFFFNILILVYTPTVLKQE